LGCPDCGTPLASGQRFCTTCGRRAPIRGAQTVVRRIDRKAQETPHFRIRYVADSFAEQQLAGIAGRLENAYGIIAGLLSLQTPPRAKIEVHLAELLDDPKQPGIPMAEGGYAVPERLEIHEVYRADAPGQGLDRSLLQVLLAVAVGDERPRPAFIQDGLLALTKQRLGMFPPDDQIIPALGGAKVRRELPPISTLIGGPTQATAPIYPLAAAGFTGYLHRTFGPDRLREFARRLGSVAPDDAAKAAFGDGLTGIDKAWRKTLKVAQPGGVLRFMRLSSQYLRPHKLKVIEVILYISLSVGFTIGLQKMQQQLIDRALPGVIFGPDGPVQRVGDQHALAVIMGIVVGAFVIVSLTSLRESYVMAWVSEKVIMDIRLRIFSNLQRLQPGFFQRVQTGDIMSRMTSDLAAIEFALTGAVAGGFRIVLTLIAAVITVFWTDWKLALFAMALTPLFFIAGKFLGPAAARASFARQEHLGEATSVLQENLAAQPVVKAFGLQQREVTGYTRSLNTLFRSSLRLTFLSGIFGLSANSIASAIQLAVLGLGGYLVIEGNLTVGTLLLFLGLMGQIIGPLQSISQILQALQQASGAMDRVDEILKVEPEIRDEPGARPAAPLRSAIRFENVSFSYSEDQPILRNLTFTIPAGRNVALVGPSGCGKSTVLNLIMRFYEAQAGQVAYDGADLRSLTLDSLRAQMGIVFQDNFLFNASIRENIRMGRQNATDDEVEAAAKSAEIHDLIMQMPEGYDTLVGERGGRLSGGQRQRVAIARAIIRNPSILLLDEATSALDPRTEAAINETLDRISRGRTTISVTHRLASVVNADQIFVFDRGGLAEQGTHDDLVKKGGLYASLWQEQGGFMLGAGVQYVGVEASRLQGVPLFAQLDGDLLAALSQRLAVERYPAGDVIVNEGDVGDKLYIVHKGQAEVLAFDRTGQQRPLNVLREGDHFGEIALLFDVPRMATIRALTPIQLYSLSKEDFGVLLQAVPGLREVLEQTMAQRAQGVAVQR
jgi:ATP-binding cassette subfamily B protein